MKLLNELLSLSEADFGHSLVGLTINRKLITDETKDEVWAGDFDCQYVSNLTSLKGSPKEVTGDFACRDNRDLVTLEGAPEIVRGNFYCTGNPKLKSLKGAPVKIGHLFSCAGNYNLTSFEGAPKEIGGTFTCASCLSITSLKGIHKHVPHIGGKFYAKDTPIKSHVLGLLLIKGCTGVSLDNKKVETILNKHLPNDIGNKGLINCQSELLDADLDDFAEL